MASTLALLKYSVIEHAEQVETSFSASGSVLLTICCRFGSYFQAIYQGLVVDNFERRQFLINRAFRDRICKAQRERTVQNVGT